MTSSEKQLSQGLVSPTPQASRRWCHVPGLRQYCVAGLAVAAAGRRRNTSCDSVGVAPACGTHAAGCTDPAGSFKSESKSSRKRTAEAVRVPLLPSRSSQSSQSLGLRLDVDTKKRTHRKTAAQKRSLRTSGGCCEGRWAPTTLT